MGHKKFEKDYAKYYDLFNQDKDYSQEINFLEEIFKKYGCLELLGNLLPYH